MAVVVTAARSALVRRLAQSFSVVGDSETATMGVEKRASRSQKRVMKWICILKVGEETVAVDLVSPLRTEVVPQNCGERS
jgi:hypothetical protein